MLRYFGFIFLVAACNGPIAVVADKPDIADTDTDADADTDTGTTEPLAIVSLTALQDVTDLDVTVTFTGPDGPATLQVLLGGLISLVDVDVLSSSATLTLPIPDPCAAVASGSADLSVSLDGATWVDTSASLAGRVTYAGAYDELPLDRLVLACTPSPVDLETDWYIDAGPGTYGVRVLDARVQVRMGDYFYGTGFEWYYNETGKDDLPDMVAPEEEPDALFRFFKLNEDAFTPYVLAVWPVP